MKDLVVATSNAHKLAEIRAVLTPLLGRAPDGLGDLPGGAPPEPAEDGATFEANATTKAREYALRTGRPCLADDSGLVVDALGGAPGVHSSHYAADRFSPSAGRAARDAANNAKLIAALDGVPPARRTARFVCVMVLADPTGEVSLSARGTFEGRIGEPPRVPSGANGFGYDPLFLVGPTFERTCAELSEEEKNARSHRGAALRSLAAMLLPRAGA